MKLTNEQRAAIYDGTPVKFTFDGSKPCPISVGYIKVLSKHVKLEVTEIYRTAPTPKNPQGDHSLGYIVHRNGDRYMARQQGQSHPEQYVFSPAGGFDKEAGASVDEFTQQRITNEARVKAQKDVAEHLQALERLEAVLTHEMKSRNLTIQGELHQARARIRKAKQKIEGQAKGLETINEKAA